jgi:acetoin utilization deacetylase AcuC-like enzyme
MDSSISHDPFAPDVDMEGNPMHAEPFNAARWEQAGATEEQIAELEAAYNDLSVEERNGITAWMKSVSNAELAVFMHSGSSIEELETAVAEAQQAYETAEKGEKRIAARTLKAAQQALDTALAAADAAEAETPDEAAPAVGRAIQGALGSSSADVGKTGPNGGQEPDSPES